MRLALVGAGNVADRYAAAIGAEPELELAGATDLDGARAEALVAEHGGRAYADLDAVLADDGVDTVVNLTVPQAQFDAAAAPRGREARAQREAARARTRGRAPAARACGEHDVRLSSAPTTLLGEAPQTLWKHVRDGAVGTVRAAYAEANWDRIERWHPDPRSLYAVGPVVDVGVYPLTILTAMFGPVRLVRAYATTLEPERALLDGTAFTPAAPDFIVAVLEHESGVVTRLTASFYVGRGKQSGIEVHGDEGSFHLSDWMQADSPLDLQRRGRRVRGDSGAARAVQGDRLGPCARRPGAGDRRGAAAPCRRRARRPRRRDPERRRVLRRRRRHGRRHLRVHDAGADGLGAMSVEAV